MTTRDNARTAPVSLGVLCLLGVPLLLLLGLLIQLCRHVWFGDESALGYQALIPLGALALVWHRRADLNTIVQELAALFPDPGHPKRGGSVWLALIGGLLIVLGILAAMPALGIVGLIVIAAGVVLCLWGPFVLRGLIGPLGYLLLMLIPPPMPGITGTLTAQFHLRSVAFTGYILRMFKQETQIQGAMLTRKDQVPLYIPVSFSGLEILLTALAFGIFVVAWRKLRVGATLLLLFVAVVLALVINQIRMLTLVQLQDPRWLPSFPFALLECALLWLGGLWLARRAAAREAHLS